MKLRLLATFGSTIAFHQTSLISILMPNGQIHTVHSGRDTVTQRQSHARNVATGLLLYAGCLVCGITSPAVAQPGVTAASQSGSAPLAVRQRSTDFEELIVKADRQIAAGQAMTPAGDNALDTFRVIISLISGASLDELALVREVPSRFAVRAAAADAAGRHEEAENYLLLGRVFDFGKPADDSSIKEEASTSADAGTALRSGSALSENRSPSPVGPQDPQVERLHAITGSPSSADGRLGKVGTASPPAAPTNLPPPSTILLNPMKPAIQRDGTALQVAPPVSSRDEPSPSYEGSRQSEPRLSFAVPRITGLPSVGPQSEGPRATPAPRASGSVVERSRPLHGTAREVSLSSDDAATSRCRAITVKVQLGEDPSDAERAYLRRGCQPR